MKTGRVITLFLATTGLLAADIAHAGLRSKGKDVEQDNIYKHFVGTVGTDKVVIDIRWGYSGGANNGGSFFYNSASKDFRYLMIKEPDSKAHNAWLHASEYKIDQNWFTQNSGAVPTWDFVINGHTLTGKWHSADRTQELDITLKEDYSNAIPLKIMGYTEQAKKSIALYGQGAKYDFVGVKPADDVKQKDAEFISNSLLQQAADGKAMATNWSDYPKTQGKKIINEFNDRFETLTEKEKTHGYHKTYYAYSMMPIYNENGILSMQYIYYNDEKSGHSFRNIDVASKKTLQAADIFTQDKATLTKMLRTAYSTQPNLDEKALASTDNIIPTENLVVTHNGIAFNYFAGTCGTDEVWLFLTYDQLKDVLTPGFKEKMKI